MCPRGEGLALERLVGLLVSSSPHNPWKSRHKAAHCYSHIVVWNADCVGGKPGQGSAGSLPKTLKERGGGPRSGLREVGVARLGSQVDSGQIQHCPDTTEGLRGPGYQQTCMQHFGVVVPQFSGESPKPG